MEMTVWVGCEGDDPYDNVATTFTFGSARGLTLAASIIAAAAALF